jgi:predicted nucleic acid-binding protein
VKFVDSSFWIAFVAPRDQRHAQAAAIWAADPGALITTNLVVGETWTFLRKRADHRNAVRFIDQVERSPSTTLVHVGPDLEEEAWRWLRRHDERPYSFVDATSFALMRRRRLREALAFDGDFTAAGFIEVRPGGLLRRTRGR